jgi:hypothetical protein
MYPKCNVQVTEVTPIGASISFASHSQAKAPVLGNRWERLNKVWCKGESHGVGFRNLAHAVTGTARLASLPAASCAVAAPSKTLEGNRPFKASCKLGHWDFHTVDDIVTLG